MNIFSTPFIKDIRFSATGRGVVTISVDGRNVISAASGEIRVEGAGSHTVGWTVDFRDRGTVSIYVDNAIEVDEDNHTIVTRQREIECVQYEIPDARTQCRSGYRKDPVVDYRTAQTVTSRGVRGPTTTRTAYGPWVSTRPSPPRDYYTPGAANSFRRGENGRVETRTRYFCNPEIGHCSDTEDYQEESHNPVLRGSFTVFNETTPEQVSQLERERLEALERERIAREEERLAEVRRQQEEQNRINMELERIANNLNNPTISPTTQQTITFAKSRYRVITPITSEYKNGQVVPRVRFESVRELLPRDVERLIFAGYELTPVEDTYPIVSSRPYSQSIVERNKALAGQIQNRIVTPLIRNTRQGFTPEILERHRLNQEREKRSIEIQPRSERNQRRRVA